MSIAFCLCERCSETGGCPCWLGSMFLGGVLALSLVLAAALWLGRGRSGP